MSNENDQNHPFKISNILYFSSIKNEQFDYTLPIKASITKFSNNRTEISPSLFEYLCFKIAKRKNDEKKLNNETAIISEKFLSSKNIKLNIEKLNAIHKPYILIPVRNEKTLKWNAVLFLNLERQIMQYMSGNNSEPIFAKIISSNYESDEDDIILNTTMDKLETAFNFTSPDNIQFEVDSINISDQPNTSIFLLNFIEGLISQKSEKIFEYIMKLYDQNCNNNVTEGNNYFTSFNKENDIFNDLINIHQNEMLEYFNNNNININQINENNNEIETYNNNNSLGILINENNENMGEIYSTNNIQNQQNFGGENNYFGIIQEVENESEDESEHISKLTKSKIINSIRESLKNSVNNDILNSGVKEKENINLKEESINKNLRMSANEKNCLIIDVENANLIKKNENNEKNENKEKNENNIVKIRSAIEEINNDESLKDNIIKHHNTFLEQNKNLEDLTGVINEKESERRSNKILAKLNEQSPKSECKKNINFLKISNQKLNIPTINNINYLKNNILINDNNNQQKNVEILNIIPSENEYNNCNIFISKGETIEKNNLNENNNLIEEINTKNQKIFDEKNINKEEEYCAFNNIPTEDRHSNSIPILTPNKSKINMENNNSISSKEEKLFLHNEHNKNNTVDLNNVVSKINNFNINRTHNEITDLNNNNYPVNAAKMFKKNKNLVTKENSININKSKNNNPNKNNNRYISSEKENKKKNKKQRTQNKRKMISNRNNVNILNNEYFIDAYNNEDDFEDINRIIENNELNGKKGGEIFLSNEGSLSQKRNLSRSKLKFPPNKINSNITNNIDGFDDCKLSMSRDMNCGCVGDLKNGCWVF